MVVVLMAAEPKAEDVGGLLGIFAAVDGEGGPAFIRNQAAHRVEVTVGLVLNVVFEVALPAGERGAGRAAGEQGSEQ